MVHGCAPLLLALPGRAQAPAVSPWLPGAGRTGRWSRLAGSHGAPSSPRCAGAVRPAPAVPCCRELLYGAVLPPCPVQPRSPSCWWCGAVGIAAAAPARQPSWESPRERRACTLLLLLHRWPRCRKKAPGGCWELAGKGSGSWQLRALRGHPWREHQPLLGMRLSSVTVLLPLGTRRLVRSGDLTARRQLPRFPTWCNLG